MDINEYRGCHGKVKYLDERTAIGQIELMARCRVRPHQKKKYHRRDHMVLSAYECRYCGFWHVGHLQKGPLKANGVDPRDQVLRPCRD